MGPNHGFHDGVVAILETIRQFASFPDWKTTLLSTGAIVSIMGTKPNPAPDTPFRYYIKEWMEHDGWSDERMAEQLGLGSRSTIWKWYNSEGGVSELQAARVAKVLNRSPYELLHPPGVPSLDAMAEGVPAEVRAAMVADIAKHLKRRK